MLDRAPFVRVRNSRNWKGVAMLLSRRDLLRKTAVVGASIAAGAAGVTLWGCKKELHCTDTSGLTPDEIAMRNTLAYADASPEAGKTCSNCTFFNAAASPDVCGGCKVLKG